MVVDCASCAFRCCPDRTEAWENRLCVEKKREGKKTITEERKRAGCDLGQEGEHTVTIIEVAAAYATGNRRQGS